MILNLCLQHFKELMGGRHMVRFLVQSTTSGLRKIFQDWFIQYSMLQIRAVHPNLQARLSQFHQSKFIRNQFWFSLHL